MVTKIPMAKTAVATTAQAASTAGEGADKPHPKYYVVKGRLAEMLAGLSPGEALPPERALAEIFSTSRTTVRQALHELTIEGRLVRRHGRGTFAAPPKVAQPLQLTSYTEDMRRQGLASRSRLLSVSYVRPTRDWPSAFNCAGALACCVSLACA